MLLTIISVNHDAGSSVATATGLNSRGRLVTFGGDWRPMLDLAEAVAAGEEPQVEIEPWQVLGVSTPKSLVQS